MKTILLFSLLGGVLSSSLSAATWTPVPTVRQKIILNPGWKFSRGDVANAQSTGFSDDSWTTVNLPHDADVPAWINADTCYVGYTWYRKHFTLPVLGANHVFIEFGAAFQHAWVYVNGTPVGEHKGGYTGFSYDITSAANAGDNVLAVRLSNRWDPQIAPRAGDHLWHNGIYRDVWLEITPPLHVSWYGLAISSYKVIPSSQTVTSSPVVDYAKAVTTVKTEVKNESQVSKNCTVQAVIVDAANQIAGMVTSSLSLNPGQTNTFVQFDTVQNPHLWSISDPYLYHVYVTVYDSGVAIDNYSTKHGFRFIYLSSTSGCYLNGTHVYLRGFDAHQDHAGWIEAVTDAALKRDIAMMKIAGANCVRASHYPHAQAWYEACDSLGILVWDEFEFWGRGGFSGSSEDTLWNALAYPTVAADKPAFDTIQVNCLKEMIRERYNHPAIFCWSVGNEYCMSGCSGQQNIDCATFVKNKLNPAIHTGDSTRPSATGETYADSGFTDVGGHNNGLPSSWSKPYPVFTSEYGTCTFFRGVLSSDSYAGCAEPTQDAWRCGSMRWCAFQFATHNTGTWNCRGAIDYNRLPCRAYYWCRANWAGIAAPTWPVAGTARKLGITVGVDSTKRTIMNDGTDDVQLIVTVLDSLGKPLYDSLPNVTLAITSGSGMLPTGTSWTFGTPAGCNAIEFRSYTAGSTTLTASSPGLQSGSIMITTVASPNLSYTTGLSGSLNRQVISRLNLKAYVSRNGLCIRYHLPENGTARLAAFNVLGRVVWSRSESATAGNHTLEWGSGVSEKPVPPGIYWISLKSNGRDACCKVEMVR